MASSRAVWQEWIEQHHAALYRFAYRLSGRCEDAEDLVHDTLLAAAHAKSPLREPEAVRGWLFSILRNAFLMKVRRRQNGRFDPLPDDLPEGEESSSSDLNGPDVELLQRLLDQMPEGYRTPLILFYFEEFSYRQIAEQMDIAIGTVMSRLARAKDWLRQRYPWPEATGVTPAGKQPGRRLDSGQCDPIDTRN